MKNHASVRLTLVLLVVVTVLESGAFASAVSIDDPAGFRDLTFGQDQSAITGLSAAPLAVRENTSYYNREADSLLVADIRVNWILYGFDREKLKEVQIQFKPETDTAVLEAFTKKWGAPKKGTEKSEDGGARDRYAWNGQKVTATLVCRKVNVSGTITALQPLLTLSGASPAPDRPVAKEPTGTFEGIRVGDAFANHKAKFEASPPDSDRPGYKGKTYYHKSLPVTFAGITFDLFGIGLDDDTIEHFYFWLRTQESQLPGLREKAIESLNRSYASAGVAMTERPKGSRARECVWAGPDNETVLKTVIDGSGRSDNYATVEILVTKNKNQSSTR